MSSNQAPDKAGCVSTVHGLVRGRRSPRFPRLPMCSPNAEKESAWEFGTKSCRFQAAQETSLQTPDKFVSYADESSVCSVSVCTLEVLWMCGDCCTGTCLPQWLIRTFFGCVCTDTFIGRSKLKSESTWRSVLLKSPCAMGYSEYVCQCFTRSSSLLSWWNCKASFRDWAGEALRVSCRSQG